MDQNDSFEISDNKGLVYLINESDKPNETKDDQKIIKLSKMCLEEHVLVKTKKAVKPLSTIKSTQVADSKIFLWNHLKQMPDIPTKEQLHDLILLCDLKKQVNSKSSDILSFAFDLAKNHEAIGVQKLRYTIGKLIFLVNQNITQVIASLGSIKGNEQILHIDTCFENEMNKINLELLQFKESHKKGLLQNPNKALSTRIPVVLAKALISDTGFVNIGIIEILMKRFLQSENRSPYEKNIAYVLNSIQRSSLLRQKIHLIKEPFSQVFPANDLIRITLGLPSGTITTSLDAKRTALAALLSHMRQSPASTCFASYLATGLLSKELAKCLDDFCALLHKSSISRFVNDRDKEFPFLMRTGKESISQIIGLNNKGKIYSQNELSCYIWEVPGIKAACNSLGLTNAEKTLQRLISDLKIKDSQNISISVSKILKLIAKKTPGDPLYNYSCAKLSFESQLHNPLLRMWENVIASMAEATGFGKITEKLVKSVVKSLEKVYASTPFKFDLQKSIKENLRTSVHFAYDTDIKSKKISNDGRSGRGAFILYNRCGSHNPAEWQLIGDIESFRKFVCSIVKQAFREIKSKEKKLIFEALNKHIGTNEFIVDCLRIYDEENLPISDVDLIKDLETLSHTPWIDRSGNNSNEVLRIYFDQKNQVVPTILNPKSAAKLFLSLIEIGRKFNENSRQTLNQNPQMLTPLIIKDVHAFSMMFGHETFINAINSKKSARDWIYANLITTGKEISESKMTKDDGDKFILFFAHSIIPKNDKEGLAKFNEKANLIPCDLTLSAFRNRLVAIIKEISNEHYKPMNTIIAGIDFFIYKCMIPLELQIKLAKSAVHFADTNWGGKLANVLQDVHFCFIFNPWSEKIEMWEIYDDSTGLYPLNQHDWITNQTWEIYPSMS